MKKKKIGIGIFLLLFLCGSLVGIVIAQQYTIVKLRNNFDSTLDDLEFVIELNQITTKQLEECESLLKTIVITYVDDETTRITDKDVTDLEIFCLYKGARTYQDVQDCVSEYRYYNPAFNKTEREQMYSEVMEK